MELRFLRQRSGCRQLPHGFDEARDILDGIVECALNRAADRRQAIEHSR